MSSTGWSNWARRYIVLVVVTVGLSACGGTGGGFELSAVEQRRASEIANLFPDTTEAVVNSVVTLDECPEGPEYEEPIFLPE